MLVHKINKVLEIPSTWNDLLNIEYFDDNTRSLQTFEDIPVNSSRPYKDDVRTIVIHDDEFVVTACLCSGKNNYYLFFIVDGPDDIYCETDPEFIVTEGTEEIVLDTKDGSIMLNFDVKVIQCYN